MLHVYNVKHFCLIFLSYVTYVSVLKFNHKKYTTHLDNKTTINKNQMYILRL